MVNVHVGNEEEITSSVANKFKEQLVDIEEFCPKIILQSPSGGRLPSQVESCEKSLN